MTSLTDASTFGLAEGDLIVAVVESLNTIGYSATSPENTAGALVQVVPGPPPSAPTRGAATSDSQLEVEYAVYSDDGGSPILTYALDIDREDGAGFVEEVDGPGNSVIITTGISSGETYQVRYRATNVHGRSADSAVLEIVAATVPSAPNTVEVANSADNSVATVNVAWSTPSVLGGNGITIASYAVFIRQNDGSTFSEAPAGSGCSPSSPAEIATIVANENCDIEMSVLRATPFDLVQGDPIVVKMQAQNVIGWSADSAIDSSAVVQTEPLKPSSAPTRAATSS
jgi:hypothetical protein